MLLWSNSVAAANYSVTTIADAAGSCTGASPNFNCPTLRAAIIAANATTTADDTIQFSVSGTISLASSLPLITDTLGIDGSGITLSSGGNGFSQIRFSGIGASNSFLQNMALTGTTANSMVTIDSGAADVTIHNNTLTGSGTVYDGIRCLSSNNCIITGNTLNGTFAYAISLYSTVTSVIASIGTISENIVNATTSNSSIGVGAVSGVTVSSNVVLAAGGCGISLYQGNIVASNANNSVLNNTVSGGAGTGICLSDGLGAQTTGNTIQGNTITGMGLWGIRLNSTTAGGITNNVITGNTITGNSRDGIAVIGAGAQNNAIYANTSISGNGGLGIDLLDNGVTPNDAGDVDTGPNGVQNFPVVTSISGNTVKFVLDTSANTNGFRIDF
ncbi:right-handed parallel beta-helix repeat-containing protein, partial [Stenotrophomonas sp. ATCM1_4]|uniref:right-handed parallel beta-helix repeat-containing protein n=1 Tax=Stenotrophomonas sp. ATCM1_4 TaxID=2259330 RepID=UPI0014050631